MKELITKLRKLHLRSIAVLEMMNIVENADDRHAFKVEYAELQQQIMEAHKLEEVELC